MVKLSDRLQAVADMITPGLKVADVGCDHGYLSIYLMENKIAENVIASDVREGPLSKAKNNVRIYGVSDQVDVRLSDGLENIEPGEVDCIVMSGMGGNLMMDIMKRGQDVIDNAKELVLQPQSELSGFRHFLMENGYLIISEAMVYEDYKYYPMLKVVHGDMSWDREIFFLYGKILLREENPVLHQFLLQERDYYVNLYNDLCCQNRTDRVIERLKDVELSLKYNNEALDLINEVNSVEIDRVLV